MKISSYLDMFDEKTVLRILVRVLQKIKTDEKDPKDCSMQYLIDAVRETFPEIEKMHKSKEYVMHMALMENARMFRETCNKFD